MAELSENKLPPSKKTEKILEPQRDWPLRLVGNMLMLGGIAVVAALVLTLKNDWVGKRLEDWQNDFYSWAGRQGLLLDDVIVTGRNRTTMKEIQAAAGLQRGDNVLRLDVFEIKRRLEELPWVARAEVRRSFFPNVVFIRLTEREVRAIWQINEKFYPIDGEGKVINADFRTREPILLIVGAGAPENMAPLLEAIGKYDADYIRRIKVANFISKRRWNLILDDIREGITIKLPEDDIAGAWKKLLKLNETKGILKRKLTIIDLRLPEKIVVKLRKTKGDAPVRLDDKNERKI